jgi:hypothetical protein
MSTTYQVEIQHEGQTHVLQVADDTPILTAAAAAGLRRQHGLESGFAHEGVCAPLYR